MAKKISLFLTHTGLYDRLTEIVRNDFFNIIKTKFTKKRSI